MTRKRSKRYSQAERKELLELYRQSGYSLYRFSKEMNLGYDTIKRWLEGESSQNSLVEVTAAEAPVDRPVQLSVRLPNGLVCELVPEMSPAEVLNWLRELKTC